MSENSKRPEFCCDVINNDIPLPEVLELLYTKNEITEPNDAIVVVLHVLMFELGFIPKDVPKNAMNFQMPNGWQKKDLYEMSYEHSLCPNVIVNLKCLKVTTKFLAIYGSVNQECNTSNGQYNMHIQLEDYIIHMPDSISKIRPIWGFSSLPTDIKLHIMSFLDAPSLLKMSCVNVELNELAELPNFWKSLLRQDFPFVNLSEVENYKQKYKEEFENKKAIRKQMQRYVTPELIPYPVQPIPLPGPGPFWEEPGEISRLRFRVPPEVENAFPQLTIHRRNSSSALLRQFRPRFL
ncbi:F-box only protein 7-like isoform X2 [Centruroides vittatus]|uniref:F-box only protein 7-like isoform X2 n=1 Tax=Centruroides vittatus TaxID=120091 RepID=UPI00350EE709